jgi:altronate dehydratase small subunit
MEKNIVIIKKKDNVATAIRDLAEGEILVAEENLGIKAVQSIPFGHKVAIKDIQPREEVIKYGESIGIAFFPIKAGEHVHVHNIEGRRGRGDQRGGESL